MKYSTRPKFDHPTTPTYVRSVLLQGADKLWCAVHPTGYVGHNKMSGKPWTKCSKGFKTGEGCDLRRD